MTYSQIREKIADNLGDGMALGSLITPGAVDVVDDCAPGVAQEPAFTATGNTSLLYDQGSEVVTRLTAAATVDDALQEFAHGNILAVATYQQAERVADISDDTKETGGEAADYVTEVNDRKTTDAC